MSIIQAVRDSSGETDGGGDFCAEKLVTKYTTTMNLFEQCVALRPRNFERRIREEPSAVVEFIHGCQRRISGTTKA